MILDATDKSLEIVLATIHTSTAPVVITDWVDCTTTTTTPGCTDSVTNGSTAVTIVAAPGASTQRIIKGINVYNGDTVHSSVIIRLNHNSTYCIVYDGVLGPGDVLKWTSSVGWHILDNTGALRMGGATLKKPQIMYNAVKDLANVTAVTAMATNVCYFCFCGVAQRRATKVDVLTRVTTGVATNIIYAELAIYSGPITLNGNAILGLLGYADVTGTYNGTGIIKTTITLTTNIQAGTYVWVACGSQATTPFQVRGCLADPIQSGLFQTLGARLSTSGTAMCTIAGAAVVPPWFTVKIYS